MTESYTVVQNARLRATRVLPIDKTVASDGTIEMLLHLKIAEGVGSNIPRMYFHDDTAGKTGKIHVGFFGPHRHLKTPSADFAGDLSAAVARAGHLSAAGLARRTNLQRLGGADVRHEVGFATALRDLMSRRWQTVCDDEPAARRANPGRRFRRHSA